MFEWLQSFELIQVAKYHHHHHHHIRILPILLPIHKLLPQDQI